MPVVEGFTILERRNCRNNRKNIYRCSRALDEKFVEQFDWLGACHYFDFAHYAPAAQKFFRIRSDAFDLEIEGGLFGNEVILTFPKIAEVEAVELFERELRQWLDGK